MTKRTSLLVLVLLLGACAATEEQRPIPFVADSGNAGFDEFDASLPVVEAIVTLPGQRSDFPPWPPVDDPDYVRALALGRHEAGAAIEARQPHLLYIGSGAHGPHVDPVTALPWRGQGSMDDARTAGYRDGWNTVMRDAHDRGLLEGLTLREKLLDREQLAALFAASPGRVLRVGDEPVELAPDCVAWLQPVKAAPGWAFVHVRAGHAQPPLLAGVVKRTARVLLAHDGTSLVVDAGERGYVLVDLPSRCEVVNLQPPL